MKLRKFRWSKVYESNEEELLAFLKARNLDATCEMGAAMSEPQQYRLDHESTLWCAEGSLALIIDDDSLSLQPGDAVRIPADTLHAMQAGISGYTCYRT